MEKELNIAAILKEKPAGTKLWSPIVGQCTFKGISSKNGAIVASFVDKDGEQLDWDFNEYGKTFSAPKEAEVCLFPSKEMRSWEKFAWKKGDMLASNNVICVFGGFRNDDYTKFNALNAICISPYDNKNEAICSTSDFSKVESEKDIKNYLLNSQIIFGNIKLPACDIEQPKPEFKDGDIVFAKCEEENKADYIVICKKIINYRIYDYCSLNIDTNSLDCTEAYCLDLEFYSLHLATDSEKQQLIDALAKEGKVWNSETKQIEDLPKKCELKAFDFVLVNDKGKDSLWFMYQLAFEFNKKGYKYYCMIGGRIFEANLYNILPYNDQTKHLLGTTDEWKGGK